jgi:hypothetical protein
VDKIEIMLKTPILTEELTNQISTFGHDLVQLIQTLEHIRHEISLEGAQKPHVAWQIKKGFISALASPQPNQIHFAIAQEAIKDEKIPYDIDSAEYREIIGILTRKINEHCKTLNICLIIPAELKNAFEYLVQTVDESLRTKAALDIIELPENLNIDNFFEKDELFLEDQIFLLHLKHLGKNGKDYATNILHLLKNNLATFKQTGKNTLSFWINTQPTTEKPIFLSPAMLLLAKALWHDVVSKKTPIIIKGVPSLIENDQELVEALLSQNNTTEKTIEGNINIINDGTLLGSIPIPMISGELHATVINGIKKINTVEGHRLLRFVPRTAFNQMASLVDDDYRIIKRQSYAEIAAELKLKSRKHISSIKEILHSMAYLDFKRPNFSGNLITLKKVFSQKTHRQDGVEITVGTMLLPYRSCESFKNGESNLLIPIMPDPILVGANQYHAGLYLLQMKIMGEFCKQSVTLAKKGFIEIPNELWIKLAIECNVENILTKILDSWTQDGDTHKFLNKVDKNLYTLGEAHKKEQDVLIRQGNLRILQSHRGIVSAQKKKTKI